MVHVALSWKRIDWKPDETWGKHVLPKLEAVGLKVGDLKRCVYVIRLNGDYCISYPNGTSPTLYVGEGNFNQRINSHRKWVTGLKELVGDFSFQVCIALPRVRRSPNAYLDTEAAILERFEKLFHTAPLWNKQFETRRNDYSYSNTMIDQAICKRSGAKFKWEIKPMKSSEFYSNFIRTHR